MLYGTFYTCGVCSKTLSASPLFTINWHNLLFNHLKRRQNNTLFCFLTLNDVSTKITLFNSFVFHPLCYAKQMVDSIKECVCIACNWVIVAGIIQNQLWCDYPILLGKGTLSHDIMCFSINLFVNWSMFIVVSLEITYIQLLIWIVLLIKYLVDNCLVDQVKNFSLPSYVKGDVLMLL